MTQLENLLLDIATYFVYSVVYVFMVFVMMLVEKKGGDIYKLFEKHDHVGKSCGICLDKMHWFDSVTHCRQCHNSLHKTCSYRWQQVRKTCIYCNAGLYGN